MEMKNMVRKMFFVTSAVLLCTMCTAGAEYIKSIDYDYTTNQVEISGKDFEGSNNQYATIFLVTNGETKEDFVPTTDDANVANMSQVKISDGKFDLKFELNNPVEGMVYTAYVRAGNSDKMSSFKYTSDIDGLYSYIMGASDISQAISDKSAELILNDTVYGELDDVSNIGNMISKAELTEIKTAAETDKAAAIELLKDFILRASYIQALNEGKLSSVVEGTTFRDPELLGFDELGVTAYEIYTNQLKTSGTEKVLSLLLKQGYKNIEELQEDFVLKTTIAAIRYSNTDGTAHIKSILEDNNAVNKFDFSNYEKDKENTIDLLLLNSTKWGHSDIQEILDTELEEDSDDPTTPSGSGGSGITSTGQSAGGYSQNYSIGGLTETTTSEAPTFTDLDGVEWAREHIEALAAAGVVSGRGNGIYAPLDSVTRAEFLQMLVKALGVTSENATCDFADVIAGEWYYNAVATGTTFGLASGYGNGYFGTTDLITRQDAAVMLNNAAVKSGKELTAAGEDIDFADKAEISDYAADDVEILVKAGILSGANGSFMPKNNATRAEAAVMISKLMTALGLEG